MGRMAIAAAVGLTMLLSAGGQAAGAESRPLRHTTARETDVVPPSGPTIVLRLHQGTLIRPPAPVSTVFVADSDIADVTIKTPTLIYVTAKKVGDTVIYAVDANDRVLVNTRVTVEYDLPRLGGAYQRLLPGELIEVHSVGQDIVLTGTVTTAGAARKAVQIATQMFGLGEAVPPSAAATPGAPAASAAAAAGAAGHVVNQLVVATPNQVNLRVRIAEVNATAMKELGITLTKSGVTSFSTAALALTGATPSLSTLQPLAGTGSISAALDALETEGLAVDLAEPNLTATSGQNANFGVVKTIQIPGQSIPVTTVSTASTTTAASATTSTQPLSAGITLDFRATIIDADHITLTLRPEVSTFDTTEETTVAGTTIPAVDQTVAQTTVDLASGQTFALAGLLQRNINEQVSKVPGLGDLPYVGAAFRSRTYNATETELVIVVTPYIVKPVATALATPVDGFRVPNDVSQALMGSMYQQQLPTAPAGPTGPGGQGLMGLAGFRLD